MTSFRNSRLPKRMARTAQELKTNDAVLGVRLNYFQPAWPHYLAQGKEARVLSRSHAPRRSAVEGNAPSGQKLNVKAR